MVAMPMPVTACRALHAASAHRAAQSADTTFPISQLTNPENNPCIQTVTRIATKI